MKSLDKIATISRAIVRLAGDSGDGMQLLGDEWVKACAVAANDMATCPDFPAEIRAPIGTLAGVSGFQIQFASEEVFNAGDRADVLIALNPAALKANIKDLRSGGLLIINYASFNELSLSKAAYLTNPLEDRSLASFQLLSIDMNGILRHALKESSLSSREVQKCKNFFCLGLLFWLYQRDLDQQIKFINDRFKHKPDLKNANLLALRAGFLYGENTETIAPQGQVLAAPLPKGTYRALSGNKALALGLMAASHKAQKALFYASYPITPASDILHELADARAFGANTFQAEDEMAAICAAIGAAYGGSLGVTATSGPGFSLKSEAIGYAVMVELPLIIIDVQRAGPSTGMPTKTEQADLMQAIYGRHGEAPVPVLAPAHAQDCFMVALDAVRIAINFMTPVIILSDAAIANSSTPWRIVDLDKIPAITAQHEPYAMPYQVYQRDPEKLSRAWVLPGHKDLIHQLGGLEKNQSSGKISYDPDNHQAMVNMRAAKIDRIKHFMPPPEIFGDHEGDILLLGFGGSFGAIRQACIDLRAQDVKVSHLHLLLLNPLHDEISDIMTKFAQVVVVEHNLGQLKNLIRARFLVAATGLNKVSGKSFLVEEIISHVLSMSAGVVCR